MRVAKSNFSQIKELHPYADGMATHGDVSNMGPIGSLDHQRCTREYGYTRLTYWSSKYKRHPLARSQKSTSTQPRGGMGNYEGIRPFLIARSIR